MAALKNVDSTNFDTDVLNNPKLTLVEFGANWCSSCKTMLPAMESLQDEFPQYNFVKIDIDDNTQLVKANKVKAAPTFVSFRDGKQYKIHIGTATKAQLLQLLK